MNIFANTPWFSPAQSVVVAPVINEVLEATGFETLTADKDAFRIGYEVGREDAIENDPCKICGKLPAQRAGYAFGYIGEYDVEAAYRKWNRMGRAA